MENKDLCEIHSHLKMARKNLLDILEIAYGDTPNWHRVRNKVLNILGREGLEKYFDRAGKAGNYANDRQYHQK